MHRVGSQALVVLAVVMTMAIVAPGACRPGARERTDRQIRRRRPGGAAAFSRRCRDRHGSRRDDRESSEPRPRLAAGVNVYPARLGKVALGIGGEWLIFSRGSKTLDPSDGGRNERPDGQDALFGALTAGLAEFRRAHGWSYLSGGIGWVSFTTELDDAPVADAAGRTRAINYGGGARWFAKEHLAFTFDLRFYRIDPQDAAAGRPAYGGRRMMVFSAGISLK